MAQKLFLRLRGRMMEMDINQKYLAQRLGFTPSALSDRFWAKKPFKLNEVYTICEILHIPMGEIAEYFPQNGKQSSVKLTLQEGAVRA